MIATRTRRRRPIRVFIVAAALALVFPSFTASQHRAAQRVEKIDGQDAVAGEVLVRFARGAASSDRARVERSLDVDESETIGVDVRRLRSRSFDLRTLIDHLRTQGAVAYAEPNYIVQAVATPDDPRFHTLWGLFNNGQTVNGSAGVTGADIHARRAWDVTTGSRSNVVAVIDTGVEYTHRDLAANMWSAPAAFTVTIGGVRMTCAAGTHGFNAISRTCDPRDDNGHGTHAAGIVGAAGNNAAGVTGVNWKASIMAAKFLDGSGTGTLADAIKSIEFAVQAKHAFSATAGANVRVLSNSWAVGAYSQALVDEITRANAYGMLFVSAAGNDSRSNTTTPTYPANVKAPNVVAVAATDNQDQLADFSNYGSNVHLAAPGVDIQSTTIGNTYRYLSGTSMAAPYVSGAAALVLAKCRLDTATLKSTLLSTADRIGALTGWVANGRLNVDRAIRSCAPAVATTATTPPTAPTALTPVSGPGTGQVELFWSAGADAETYSVKKSRTDGGPYTTVATGLVHKHYVFSGIAGRQYYFVVSASNSVGEGPDSAQAAAVGK